MMVVAYSTVKMRRAAVDPLLLGEVVVALAVVGQPGDGAVGERQARRVGRSLASIGIGDRGAARSGSMTRS
jgi:hypothetical protein